MGPYGVPGSLSMGPYGVPGSRDSWTRGLGSRDSGTRDLGSRDLGSRDLGTRAQGGPASPGWVLWFLLSFFSDSFLWFFVNFHIKYGFSVPGTRKTRSGTPGIKIKLYFKKWFVIFWLCWPVFLIWTCPWSFKSLFWPARSKYIEKLILSVLSTYFYLKGIDVSCLVNFQHKNSILYFLSKAILGPWKSCFD